METALGALSGLPTNIFLSHSETTIRARGLEITSVQDILQIGSQPLTDAQSTNVVLERAMSQLRAVVDEARAALGLPDGAVVDTSAEATGNRIADFALRAFDSFRNNHDDLSDEDAKAAFVEFIGAAIEQGIQEAREILGALSALNPKVDGKITTISEVIHQRLQQFLANE